MMLPDTSCERYSLAKAFSVATVFQVVRDNLGPTIISVVGCVRLSRKQAKRRQFRALIACSDTDFFSITSCAEVEGPLIQKHIHKHAPQTNARHLTPPH